MDESEVRRIAREAAREAVREIFVSLGADTANPSELQKDFIHLRRWREAVDSVPKLSLMAIVTTITVGTLGLFWALFTGAFR